MKNVPKAPAPVPPTSKIGPIPSGNRNVAESPAPQISNGETKTDLTTFFTRAGEPEIIYNGDRLWASVTFELETAGPVAIGTRPALTPVMSGKGQLLQPNQPRTINVAKGTRVWIASTSTNRVSVTVEPIPWLEQMVALVHELAAAARAFLGGKR